MGWHAWTLAGGLPAFTKICSGASCSEGCKNCRSAFPPRDPHKLRVCQADRQRTSPTFTRTCANWCVIASITSTMCMVETVPRCASYPWADHCAVSTHNAASSRFLVETAPLSPRQLPLMQMPCRGTGSFVCRARGGPVPLSKTRRGVLPTMFPTKHRPLRSQLGPSPADGKVRALLVGAW